MNPTLYEAQARRNPRKVFFTGSTALSQGMAVCYNRTYGTATDAEGRRDTYVALPSNSNNLAFAGVVYQDYAAKTGGQWIEIDEPRGVVPVLTTDSVAIGAYVTAIAGGTDAGKWSPTPGYLGKGTAKVLQTRTGAGLALVELLDGAESGLIETIQAVSATAVPMMVGGVTLITGGITIATDSTDTLADAPVQGLKKLIKLVGALTTQDYLVTVTNGIQLDGATALASLEFDGAGDYTELEFVGSKWFVTHNVGTAQA